MKSSFTALFIIILLLVCNQTEAQDSKYTDPGNGNPLVPGYFADPTIEKISDTYYLYATTDGIREASGEPQVWISKDFVNWFDYKMDVPLPDGLMNCWAPDLVEGFDGKYYYFQGNCQTGACDIYGYVSDSPVGPWSILNSGDPVIPVGTGKKSLPALDAQYFVDDDGSIYAFFGTWCTSFGGIGWAKIDPNDMTTILDEGYIPISQVPEAFEAPYLLKKNDKYILMYSTGDCQRSSYAVRYSYSNGITGTYTPGENSPILSSNDDNTINGPAHHSVLKENDDYYIVYHRHDNPHSTGGEFRQVCVDKLIFENDSTISTVKPTHTGIGYLAEKITSDNLALNAVTTASSYYHLISSATEYSVTNIDYQYLPSYAVDDNNGTMWKAGDNLTSHSLTIDLGSEKNIKRVMTQFEYPTYYYQYKIEYSLDSLTWNIFSDKTNNRRCGSPMIDDNNVNTRYIKITITGTEKAGMYAAIWNIKVYDTLFEVPSYQNDEEADGPGTMSTQSILASLNIDSLDFGTIVNNLANPGTLGGVFTKSKSPEVKWIDSVKAVYFDGNSYLKLSTEAPPTLDWNSSYTSSAWVYNPSVGSGECLMVWASRDDMNMSSYTAMMYGSGSYGAAAHGDGDVDLEFKQIPLKGEWHHLALTFDGMIEKVYVDGIIDTLWPLSLFVESSYVKIGTSGLSTERYNGFIANAQLFDKSLNEDEIVKLMENTCPEKIAEPETDGVSDLKNEDNYIIGYNSNENTISVSLKDGTSGINTLKLTSLEGKTVSLKQYLGTTQATLHVVKKGVYILEIANLKGERRIEKVVAY